MPKTENSRGSSTDRAEIWPFQAGFNTDQMKLQRLAREVIEISSLYNVAVAAGSSLNLEEIVRAIYKESGRLIDTTDGTGFEVDEATQKARLRGSLGMINLRERAELIGGELRLHSEPGRGTRLMIRVPKAADERKKRRGATGPLRLREET